MTREAIITVRDAGVAGMSDLLERIAQSVAPVLIQGEAGVGKEVLARSLHAVSMQEGELVVVRCAGQSAALLESELFGRDGKPGVLQAGGTVVLDEVGDLPPSVQDALIRALEVRFAARVIATSRHVLSELVVAGTLRAELLRLLNGITLELLPLRERRSEIVGLAQELLVEETSFPTTRFTASALATLMQYDWPGNVRELRLVVSRATLLAGAAPIEPQHLLLDVRPRLRNDLILPAPREDFLAVAREHHGNASAIARALHTSRSQVRRLASRFEVDLELLRRSLRA